MKKMKFALYKIEHWLHQPGKIFIVCLLVLVTSLIGNGTIWRLWGLHQDEIRFGQDIAKSKEEAQKLDKQMVIAKDPQHIEHLAKDKMDLVGENDLIFIFPN